MKTGAQAAIFIVGISLISGNAWSRPVDLSSPNGQVGSADERGYLVIWREIKEVGLQLGKDSYLPLRYKFSSGPNRGNILGAGFYVPMFESKNFLIREDTMQASLPCGKSLYLWRSTVDTTKFITPDREWSGTLDGDNFTVTRDDGWTILYRKSRLDSIITDEKHTFNWSYQDGGGASVSEDGHPLLSVEPNAAGLVKAFVFGAKRYEADYSKRPITEVATGQVVIKELDPALANFKYPDGKTDTFNFSITPELVPTLTFMDRDSQQTLYSWDVKNEHLATEKGPQGDWTYKIGPIDDLHDIPTITRTNADKETESYAVDDIKGIRTEKDLDGTVTVRSVFKTPGPLWNKLRSIDETSPKGKTTLVRFGYDEAGRLIRKIDSYGFATIFTYGADGKLAGQKVLPPADPTILTPLKETEKVLVEKISNAKTPDEKDDAIQQLAYFEIYRLGDIDKAVNLLSNIANPSHGFKIKMHLIVGNPNLTRAERVSQLQALLTSFPEQKVELSNLINLYQDKKSS